jgi:hypothetical protein
MIRRLESHMNTGHDDRFDGLFGEEGVDRREKPRRSKRPSEPPMAGMFGARASPLKQTDRKSPAMKPIPPKIDPDD